MRALVVLPDAAPGPAATKPRYRRWFFRIFWAWQGLYALLLAWGLFGVIVTMTMPGSGGMWPVLPIYLAPVLLPAWFPVTAVLGLLWLLSRRSRSPAEGSAPT